MSLRAEEGGQSLDENGQSLDENGQSLDENGHSLGENGQSLDENGHSLDENGQSLDENGHSLDENGQSLVEFALMLPMLILLLCGVVFCGGLVTTQQTLAVAARNSARAMALKSTLDGLNTGLGGRADEGVGKKALAQAMPNGTASLSGVSWSAIGATGRGYVGTYTKRGTVALGPNMTAGCGIGVAFYGVTVKKDLSKDLSPVGRLAARMTPGGGLSSMLTPSLTSSAVMPAELPIHGKGGLVTGGADGLLELNPWIGKVVNRPYKKKSFD